MRIQILILGFKGLTGVRLRLRRRITRDKSLRFLVARLNVISRWGHLLVLICYSVSQTIKKLGVMPVVPCRVFSKVLSKWQKLWSRWRWKRLAPWHELLGNNFEIWAS